jgi:translation initiation factor 2 alpha subunit (eIF-2alpha)
MAQRKPIAAPKYSIEASAENHNLVQNIFQKFSHRAFSNVAKARGQTILRREK